MIFVEISVDVETDAGFIAAGGIEKGKPTTVRAITITYFLSSKLPNRGACRYFRRLFTDPWPRCSNLIFTTNLILQNILFSVGDSTLKWYTMAAHQP